MGRVLSFPGYLLFLSAVLKVFVFPATEQTQYSAHPLVGMTALQALTLAALGAAWLRWAVPALHEVGVDRFRPGRRQIVAGVGFVILLVIIGGLRVLQQTPEPVAPPPAPPNLVKQYEQQPPPHKSSALAPAPLPPRTLEELTHSVEMVPAANIVDFDVETLHRGWNALTARRKDRLCDAGKVIRTAMHTYHNTVVDLNHVQRAIYDVTEPPGRCR